MLPASSVYPRGMLPRPCGNGDVDGSLTLLLLPTLLFERDVGIESILQAMARWAAAAAAIAAGLCVGGSSALEPARYHDGEVRTRRATDDCR